MTGTPRPRAVVLHGTGGIWRVRDADGVERDATLRGRLKQEERFDVKLAVGDEVDLVEDARGGAWSITHIHPRRSVLARRAPGGARGERIVAANVDQVLVVFAAAKPEPHRRMIDRFLVIAEGNEIAARLVLNKVELVPPDMVDAIAGDYERAGYPVHRTSVKQPTGLEELRHALEGRTTALTGPSGVGKSSLVNAMFPEVDLRVGEISHSVNKGRHTTVGAVFVPLPCGGFVVDTPGLREVGMWGLPSRSLDQCFPEFRTMLGECRFQDCHHLTEPDCAVREAVERGDVSPARYESYAKLRGELMADEASQY